MNLSPQLQAAIARSLYVLGGMIGAGLLAIMPELTSGAPIDRNTLIRVFVVAAIGAIGGRLTEGVTDGRRAAAVAKGDLSKLHASDVGAYVPHPPAVVVPVATDPAVPANSGPLA